MQAYKIALPVWIQSESVAIIKPEDNLEMLNLWDPLESVAEHSGELLIAARKREMQNILKSYVGFFDPFAELIQNAMDAVDARKRELSDSPKKHLVIAVNLKENSITVTDQGIGFKPDQFKTFLCPNISFKDGQLTRGRKGVGATYLAYGFNRLELMTKTPDFNMRAEIREGRKWLEDAKGIITRPKVTELEGSMPTLQAVDRGSSFTLWVGGENTRPKDLSWIGASDAEQWRTVLLLKTPLGHIDLDSPQKNEITFDLHVTDASGNETVLTKQPARYTYPHTVISGGIDLRDVTAEQQKRIEKGLDPSKLPDRFKAQNAIYGVWKTVDILKFFPSTDDAEVRALVERFSIQAYGYFCYSTKVWDQFNDKVARLRKGKRILLRGGLQLASDGMPQGDLLVIPLTSNIGYQNQSHVIVHFKKADPDLGRKGFQPELREAAEQISVAIVNNLKKWRHLLKKDSGAAPSIIDEGKLDIWIQQQRQHETTSPLLIKNPNFFLPQKEVAITSTPQSEQDVVVLFNQLLAGGVIRGIKLMSTSSHEQYDGIYKYSVKKPFEHHLFDRTSNPLGVKNIDFTEDYSSKPYVLEYKHNVDGLIQEFESQEKQESDINLVVSWDTGDEWKKRYTVTSLLDEDNIQHRPFHGVTHIFRDQNSGDVRFFGIILSELIDCLNDFESSQESQRDKYGEPS
ncbi:MAG TPA: hypothetical protein VGS15_10390 [Candidatus Acidoferrales bacterium]|nr:hypothetical protein [Candidatus Acidoferrales bacterium]